MLSSLYSGISGLMSNTDTLNVVGNNISNVNTSGYKSSRATFEDVLYQTIAGTSGTSQVGRGSALAAVETDFSQGSFETTNSPTDLAIGGAGFFIVKKPGNQTAYYTRAGGFTLDKSGNMTNSSGDYLQGKMIDQTTGTAYGVDTNIVISQQPSQPKETTEVDMVVNLQSDAGWKGGFTYLDGGGAATNVSVITSGGVACSSGQYPTTGQWTVSAVLNGGGPPTTYTVTVTAPGPTVYTNATVQANSTVTNFGGSGLDITFGANPAAAATGFRVSGFDPATTSTQSSTSNYSSSITVYDSLGTGHVMTVDFRKSAYNPATQQSTWQWYVVPQTGDVQTAGPGTIANPGILTFNNAGVLTSGGSAQAMIFDFAGAASGQTINLVMGPSSGSGATTQYPISSKTNFQTQDGYAPGVLQSISVSPDGIISGTYDNGQILKLYQLTIANFNNPQALQREGGNLYSQTLASGTAYTAAPGQGGMGKIASNSLEQSNVDLATEFVRMIVAQRGYEANSKVITTTDEILQNLMNIKR